MLRSPRQSGLLTRREIIRRGAFGLSLAAVWPAQLRADSPHNFTRAWLRYRTDPERIARVLPPLLEPDDAAEVWVEYALAALPDSIPSTIVTPASFGWSGIFVTARHGEKRGLFPVGAWISDEWGRINAREFLGLNVKHAEVNIEVDGKTIRASVRRYERTLHRVETVVQDTAMAGSETPALEKRGIFTYLYRLNPNWAEGPLGDSPVDLAIISSEANAESGASSASAADRHACALDQTVFQWDYASPLDPAVEFPVEEMLAAGFEKGPASSMLADPRSRNSPRPQAQVPAKDFEPWALLNYDRPVTNEEPWRPAGWRNAATAYRLSDEELKTYRERDEVRLGSVNIVDIQLVTEREAFLEALPPQFQPGLRLRILALRIGENDLTPAPFDEVWLFAYGLLENRPLWFALSHIVSPGGELTFGRETFGYPSKRGDVSIVTTPIDFNLLGRRNGRDFCYSEGTFEGFSTGTSLAQMDIVSLRSGPFRDSDPSGELVAQQWYFQGQRSIVDRSSLIIEFPGEGAASGLSDPWFEFHPFRVISVTVMQHGRMQRMPGEIAAQAGGISRYYLDRCDGALPGQDPAEAVAPSFRVKPAVTTRSALRLDRG
jgi:hypothetical protein